MLTLKVITTDLDGQTQTHLFSGDAISHKETFSQDHCIQETTYLKNPYVRCVGTIVATTSTQKFIMSEVMIHDSDFSFKNQLLILPKASCYVMEDGKTVDNFFCQFEQE